MDLRPLSSALPPPRASFLGLPLELRNEIYRHLLSTHYTRLDLGLGRARYLFHPAILAINRQIYDESTAVLRQENKFILIATSWASFEEDLLVQGKFPIIAECRDEINKLPPTHMFVQLDFRGEVNTNFISLYLTCLEDLPHLCRLLFYASCQAKDFTSLLHITLALQNPHAASGTVPKKLQESFLMPFAVLKGLDGLIIKGPRDEAVERQLRKAMKIPNPTAAEYLESAARLKDNGNAAFKAGDYAATWSATISARN